MNKKIKNYIPLLLFLFFGMLSAKDININSLEKTIVQYNREGKHKVSQQKLSELLLSNGLTEEEEANILFLMAATYRNVNDYVLCLDYLNKSSSLAKKLPKNNVLRMKIDYEFAFVHFDNKNFKKASQAMRRIAAENYPNTFPENKAYILMQEGYLFLLNQKYDDAEKRYSEASAIIKRVNSCNLPVVMAKTMELYNRKKDIRKVESIYKESEKMSESCGVLKYKVFLAAEMERIYKENKMYDKAYIIGLNLDSLRKLEDQGAKISEMHILEKSFLEKREKIENRRNFWEKVIALMVSGTLLAFIGFSFVRNRSLKIDKVKMEEEILQMKEDLYSHSQNYHFNEKFVNPELPIKDSDKLTERQKELLELLAAGLSNKEIAEKLFITESTVKYHVKNIYNILDLKDRKDLFKKISSN